MGPGGAADLWAPIPAFKATPVRPSRNPDAHGRYFFRLPSGPYTLPGLKGS